MSLGSPVKSLTNHWLISFNHDLISAPKQHQNQFDGKTAEITTVNGHAELPFVAICKVKLNDFINIYQSIIFDLGQPFLVPLLLAKVGGNLNPILTPSLKLSVNPQTGLWIWEEKLKSPHFPKMTLLCW